MKCAKCNTEGRHYDTQKGLRIFQCFNWQCRLYRRPIVVKEPVNAK